MARESDHGICEPGPTRTDDHGFVNRRSPVQPGSPAPNSAKSEEWRPVVGLEGIYEVSSLGRVRRLPGFGCKRARILKPGQDRVGYLHVGLCFAGQQHSRRVHRLVADAFLGPCPTGQQVDHVDGVKTHNTAANLEYVTPRENIRRAAATGLMVSWNERRRMRAPGEAS